MKGLISYKLPQDFLELKQGTYTMKILAFDIPGNLASKEIVFRVIRGIEISFNHPELGLVSTLVFKPNTEMSFNGSRTMVNTQTITLQQATIDKDAITGYTLFGVPVSVLIGTRSACGATFSQSVQLTIYYTGTETKLLPLTKSENDLILYGYDGTKWQLISEASKGMYRLETDRALMSTYTLAYITPQKWTVRSTAEKEWKDLGLDNKDWMELVGTITTDTGIYIPRGSITIGIVKDYPSATIGFKILSPVVAFYYKGERVIRFNEGVSIQMHYTELLPFETTKEKLAVYGYGNNNWNKITGVLNSDGKYISFNTKQTYESYAIMYPTSEVTPDQKKADQDVWCYPNPAKGGNINFRYYLVEGDMEVKIKIYTMLGDLVWENSRLEKYAGIHDDFVWNCQNSSGELVASGVYIYQIMMTKPKGGSTTVTRKLIVIQ
ncbi:T9SS type A sorting domain-containing protein [Candidatus Desantisbacteria bacterium]|nr:T9SS type A sorting domain-containing protein [Candidatus Desantisbacteria bacterium]